MMAVEILSSKLQDLFGSGFIIKPFYQVCKDYTTAKQYNDNGNIGYYLDYNDDYSKLKKTNIMGTVNLQNPQRANTDVYYLTSSFKIDFSVPTNVVKRDVYNDVLEQPSVNFFTRCESVINSLINTKLTFVDGDNTYYGKMVINEPVYSSVEDDGEIKYMIYSVTGTFNITDDARFGSDYEVYIKDSDNNYQKLYGINSFVEQLNTNNNSITVQNTVKVEQNLSSSGWVCVVNIDDVVIENDNARTILFDIIHKNKELLRPSETTENLKRKLPVKIITPNGDVHIFNAIVNIQFRTTRNGVGSYDISFIDDNKGVTLAQPTITIINNDGVYSINISSSDGAEIYYIINSDNSSTPATVTPMPQGTRYTDTIIPEVPSDATSYWKVQAICRSGDYSSTMTVEQFTNTVE